MRYVVSVIVLIASIISAITLFFTINQVTQEEKRMTLDLQHRSTLLAESLREAVEPNFLNKSNEYLQSVVERFANRERFAGLAVYDNKATSVAISSSLPKQIQDSDKILTNALDEDKASGDFLRFDDQKMYVFVTPLHDQTSVVGGLMIVQNADYIDTRLSEIWMNNLTRLGIQVLIISAAALFISRWVIYEPLKNLVDSLQNLRTGENKNKLKIFSRSPLLKPLVKEISTLNRNLNEARLRASEEARLRLEKIDSPWTMARLREFIKDILKGRPIVVLSNREPYIHTKVKGKIQFYFPASGMATAVEPIMQSAGGTWIAHGSGDADKMVVDEENKIKVPPNEPKYTLKRIWLTKKEEEGYYYGFSNEGLWPLCHISHTRPIFRKQDWIEYKNVNKKFAEETLKEIKNQERPLLLIQDFHLALVPSLIKKERPDAIIGLFWHIPWPNPESFSICPFRKELLEGMLGADLIGFHTQLHCNNFIETIGRELEALIDLEQFAVTKTGHMSVIKPFPISIAFSDGKDYQISDQSSQLSNSDIRKELGIKTKYIGLGVDRLDYTKGILERLKGVELFLEDNPVYKKQFSFIQIAPPSRSRIKSYQEFDKKVVEETARINAKLGSRDWKPIHLLKTRYSHSELYKFYNLADVCLVTSLHDGMNLVAKEFVAARADKKGVLILSKFAGASRELKEAIIVNPYDTEQMADAVKTALTMSIQEQKRRMNKMREVTKNNNVYRWSAEFLKSLMDLR